MIIIRGNQQDKAWKSIRSGIPTASRFSEIITPSKGKLSKSATGYMAELAGARLWGAHEDSFTSYHMQIGIEREDEARKAYEFITDNEVDQICFAYKDERKDRGCSPDGLIGSIGGVEIKSPKLKTHVEYILSDTPPITYKCQIQGEIYICDLEWIDFISYFPDSDLFIKRVYRDDAFIKKLDKAIDQFNEQLDEMVEKLKS